VKLSSDDEREDQLSFKDCKMALFPSAIHLCDVKVCENLSYSTSRVERTDFANQSFEYHFTKPFMDGNDTNEFYLVSPQSTERTLTALRSSLSWIERTYRIEYLDLQDYQEKG
jgi:hypothetical protein